MAKYEVLNGKRKVATITADKGKRCYVVSLATASRTVSMKGLTPEQVYGLALLAGGEKLRGEHGKEYCLRDFVVPAELRPELWVAIRNSLTGRGMRPVMVRKGRDFIPVQEWYEVAEMMQEAREKEKCVWYKIDARTYNAACIGDIVVDEVPERCPVCQRRVMLAEVERVSK